MTSVAALPSWTVRRQKGRPVIAEKPVSCGVRSLKLPPSIPPAPSTSRFVVNGLRDHEEIRPSSSRYRQGGHGKGTRIAGWAQNPAHCSWRRIHKHIREHGNQLRGLGLDGRGERIRTSGLLVPNQALYQAEPRPDKVEELTFSIVQRGLQEGEY